MISLIEINIDTSWQDKRTEAGKVLLLSTIFSLALICCRVVYTGKGVFLILIWNLFLALIPYGISEWIAFKSNGKNRIIFFLYLFPWLIFIPNSFYMITDLFHLKGNKGVPLWFDLVLLLSFCLEWGIVWYHVCTDNRNDIRKILWKKIRIIISLSSNVPECFRCLYRRVFKV